PVDADVLSCKVNVRVALLIVPREIAPDPEVKVLSATKDSVPKVIASFEVASVPPIVVVPPVLVKPPSKVKLSPPLPKVTPFVLLKVTALAKVLVLPFMITL